MYGPERIGIRQPFVFPSISVSFELGMMKKMKFASTQYMSPHFLFYLKKIKIKRRMKEKIKRLWRISTRQVFGVCVWMKWIEIFLRAKVSINNS